MVKKNQKETLTWVMVAASTAPAGTPLANRSAANDMMMNLVLLNSTCSISAGTYNSLCIIYWTQGAYTYYVPT